MTNEKAIMCLEDMKIKVPIPKAAKQARENNEALDVAINALQNEPHWIPWTGECDLMDNEEVLVCQKDGQIRHAMFYDFGGKKKFVTWEEGITIYNVVAYMPLPEPYKEVTE